MVSVGPYHQSTLVSYKNPQIERSLPLSSGHTVFDLLLKNPEFSTFLALVRRARLEGELSYTPNKLTVFIPSDSYLKGVININQIDIGTAINIVKMHIVNGRFGSDVLQTTAGAHLRTRYGNIRVGTENGATLISLDESPMGLAMSAPVLDASGKVIPSISGSKQVKVLYFNIELDNGLIHVTDGLLLV